MHRSSEQQCTVYLSKSFSYKLKTRKNKGNNSNRYVFFSGHPLWSLSLENRYVFFRARAVESVIARSVWYLFFSGTSLWSLSLENRCHFSWAHAVEPVIAKSRFRYFLAPAVEPGIGKSIWIHADPAAIMPPDTELMFLKTNADSK